MVGIRHSPLITLNFHTVYYSDETILGKSATAARPIDMRLLNFSVLWQGSQDRAVRSGPATTRQFAMGAVD
jgi:hypothetical protein